MASGIRISCPDCQLQMAVPETARGKKVRCKGCGAVVPVPAAKTPDTRMTKTPAAAKPAAPVDSEEEDAKKPYIVTETSLAPRCPHCAYELDPPESRICLNCGYDMIKRARAASVKTYERTFGDWFMWLLPAFACLVLAGLCVGYCFFHHYKLPELMVGPRDVAELQRYRINPFSEDSKWESFTTLIFYWPIQLWLFAGMFYAAFKLCKFAFKRLILNFTPPERIKEK